MSPLTIPISRSQLQDIIKVGYDQYQAFSYLVVDSCAQIKKLTIHIAKYLLLLLPLQRYDL